MTIGSVVIEPVADPRTARQLARDTRKHEKMAQKRLTSKGATIAAIVIAFFWTIPTFGLLVTSFRPPADTQTSGWWTVFTNPDFSLGNYSAALTSGGTTLTLAESFLNSLAITIPVVAFSLGRRVAARLRVRVDRLQVQEPAVHRGVRAADRSDPDGAGSAAEPVLARSHHQRRDDLPRAGAA